MEMMMSVPWINDDWHCLSNDIVLNIEKLAAVTKNGDGIDLFLVGSSSNDALHIRWNGQADNIWRQVCGRDPIDSGWLTINPKLAINLRHFIAIERHGTAIRLHVDSFAAINDTRLTIPLDGGGADVFNVMFQAGNKTLLVYPSSQRISEACEGVSSPSVTRAFEKRKEE